MSKLNRRDFVKAGVAASTVFSTFTIAGTKASGRVLGANDVIRIGVAGIKGRGTAHIDGFAGGKSSQVTCLIDVDTTLFDARSKMVKDKGGNTPKCVQDIRKALEDKELDAISIATCNHWHSLMTVWACQAGKDVYVEKPISHNVWEGRQCVEAAKKYGRVVQHGTQSRSSGSVAKDIAAVHSEKYGKLLVSKGYCCKPRWSIGTKEIETPPSTLDFNLWLGPAPEQPFHRNLVHYNWHWFWDTGNGDIGNQGVHQMDIARWAIKGGTLPTKVWSVGGRFLPDGPDQGQTPNTQLTVMEFGDVKLVFETRGLVGKDKIPTNVSNEYYTTEGLIRGGKFYPKGSNTGEAIKDVAELKVAPGGAFGSFLNAMRTRKPEDNNCDAEVAHYSSALCHLGNISYRLGQPAKYSAAAQALGNDKQAVAAFDAIRDNLSAVKIKFDEVNYQVGKPLTMDPKTEKFVGDDAANKLLTREYRKPFVVPDVV